MKNNVSKSFLMVFVIMLIFGDKISDFFANISNIQMAGFYGISTIISSEVIVKFKVFNAPTFDKENKRIPSSINLIISKIGNFFVRISVILGFLVSAMMALFYLNLTININPVNRGVFEFVSKLTSFSYYSFYLYFLLLSVYTSNYVVKIIEEFKNVNSSNEKLSLLITLGALIVSLVALLR